jgi:osmotically-inducible protein OsmY
MRLFKSVVVVGVVGIVSAFYPVRWASAAPQVATATAASASVEDNTLLSRITANIKKNATLAARDIDVDVHDGIVTLKGVVRTSGEKAHAARLATVRGVTEVHNEIMIDARAMTSRTAKAIEDTKRGGEKAVDATKDAAAEGAEKTKAIASATGEAITDGWITAKLKTKFFDETALKGSDINVDTDDHVVTLKGTVGSRTARSRAAAIARGTEGVTRVVNQLVVQKA